MDVALILDAASSSRGDVDSITVENRWSLLSEARNLEAEKRKTIREELSALEVVVADV